MLKPHFECYSRTSIWFGQYTRVREKERQRENRENMIRNSSSISIFQSSSRRNVWLNRFLWHYSYMIGMENRQILFVEIFFLDILHSCGCRWYMCCMSCNECNWPNHLCVTFEHFGLSSCRCSVIWCGWISIHKPITCYTHSHTITIFVPVLSKPGSSH